MEFPTLNIILFADDLFTYAMKSKGIQWNPLFMMEHRLVLKSHFSYKIGRVVVHKDMIKIVASYAFTKDFRYKRYLASSVNEAFDMFEKVLKMLILGNYGFLKVCALTVDIYFYCIENNEFKRAYETFCNFMCFLIKQDVCARHSGWRKIYSMADTMHKSFEKLREI